MTSPSSGAPSDKGHEFHPAILREYDIRGTVGKTLSAADASALGRAYGTLLRNNGGSRASVAYDGRLTSPRLEAALVEGLTSAGVDVLRFGLGPTPMLYYSVFEFETDGGIMVTGSHNPPDHNGFKMMLGQDALYGAQIQKIGAIAASGEFSTGNGTAENIDIKENYANRLLRDFEGNALDVAWDPANGATGAILRCVVDRLPGHQIILNEKVDGSFPSHHPDPTVEENLGQLKRAVLENDLDLGIGFDGDGDRIGIIDNLGNVVWGDQLLAILAREVLAAEPGATVVADVKCSDILFDEIRRLGGQPVMWKTGHSLIKTKMKELNAPLAGEMSAHIFFKDRYYGIDDALYVALRLMNVISNSGQPLSELRASLPQLINTPEIRFEVPEERKFEIVEEVKAQMLEAKAEINEIDGVRVSTPDGWWLLRASNTQAVLVARCEAKSEEGLERLKDQLSGALGQAGIEF
jgi:phosphomannomutase